MCSGHRPPFLILFPVFRKQSLSTVDIHFHPSVLDNITLALVDPTKPSPFFHDDIGLRQPFRWRSFHRRWRCFRHFDSMMLFFNDVDREAGH